MTCSRYNDVADWKWTALLDVMNGDEKHKTASHTVRTKEDLNRLLDKPAFAKADEIQLVEVLMEQLDAPRALLEQTQSKHKN